MPKAGRLTFAFVGDMMIGRRVEAALAQRRPEEYWGDYLPALQAADLVIGNLECPITQSTTRWPHPKTWRFKASERALDILKAGNFAAVNLANNHSGDYCEAGLLDSFAALEQAGIGVLGAGRDLAAARAPLLLERGGYRLGLVGLSDRMPEFGATEGRAGSNFAWPPKGEPEAARVMAAFAGQTLDLRLVAAHWGPDLMTRPTSARRRFAAALVRLGADIIHGHSSHITHGVEAIEGRPVIYDNGNCLEDFWPYPWVWTKRSSVFVLELGRDGSLLRQIPALTLGMRLSRPTGALLAAMQRRFASRARALGSRMQLVDGELHLPLALRLPA